MKEKNNIKIVARKILKIIAWVFLVLITIIVIIAITRIPHYFEVQKTQEQIVKIHNTKISLNDVWGVNLPPDPGAEADKTIQGIDANKNGIRDDVELAIFKEYKDSAKTRAGLLQYALVLQMETVQPFLNEDIATETTREQSRGFICVGKTLLREDIFKFNKQEDVLINFIKERQFNTQDRKDERKNFVKKVRSYSDLGDFCDVDYMIFSN